jgi:hypothetical protein
MGGFLEPGVGGGGHSGSKDRVQHLIRSAAANTSSKGALDVEVAAVTHRVVAGSRQFVGDCLDGDHAMPFGSLAVVPTFDGRTEAQREVGGFDPSPGQVFVAAFAIAVALGLAVGDAFALDPSRVGYVMADRTEASDVVSFPDP